MRSAEEMLDGYRQLVADRSGVFSAFCWTVIEHAVSDEDLDAWIGTGVSRAAPVGLGEFEEEYPPDADSSAWIVRLDRATALLEINGFAGSVRPNLAAWSRAASARVVSFYWNDVISKSAVSLAADGEVQQYDILDEDDLDDVPALRDAIERVRGSARHTDVPVAGLAMVESITGVVLTPELLTAAWPVLTFTNHEDQRTISAEEAELRDLAAKFGRANPIQQQKALVALAQDIIEATELTNEPAAVRLVDRLRQGEVLVRGNDYSDEIWRLGARLQQESPPVRKGKVDTHHIGWRRLQAGSVFPDLLLGPELILALNNEQGYGPLYHARWALDERWPSARDRFLDLLRGN